MSTETKGREFTHAGIIINENLKNSIRYRFLMKRKDSISNEKFMSDVWLSQEVLVSILRMDFSIFGHHTKSSKPYNETGFQIHNCYMEVKKYGTRFQLISACDINRKYWCGNDLYRDFIITMRDNQTNILYIFNTKDRYQEVGLNNIPKATKYVKTIRYEDIDFEKASLIKANYPNAVVKKTEIKKPVEKEITVKDIVSVLTETERKSIIERLSKKCNELTESIGLNELMAKFHGSK